MTVRGFKIAALVSTCLFALGFAVFSIGCLPGAYSKSCLAVETLVNVILGVAVFATLVFVFTPLVLTFIGVPLVYKLYRYKYWMSGRLSKDDVDFFLVIQEWL